ncbi:DNA-binding response regulator [Paenibacillus foliorum]|uniref:DNA-binding response regulator n=1 Tax=Paenibacillus foliorum TaxID=2654974 RepID=UPI001FE8B522|nr:DNA-binding response regulator [Paenibacillus foliorum]
MRRLQEGHGHAERRFLEQVWWPATGSFDHLHPEYEVHDFKDGTRYLDFAYLRFPMRICIEIDGYGPHSKDVSRWQFADQLMRQNHLVIDGWRIIRFSYDDISEKPRRCQQLIQQLLGIWFAEESQQLLLSPKEQQIIHFMIQKQTKLTPLEVSQHIGITDRHARTLLHRLVQAKVLMSASGNKRIRSYKLNPGAKHLSW